MPPSVNIRTARRSPAPEGLLAAATGIVAAQGLDGLSLRPLAQRLGISVSVLTSRFGARSGILAAIIAQAAEADDAIRDTWTRRLDQMQALDSEVASAVADLVLDEAAEQHRLLSLLFLECMQASAWDEEVRAASADWRAARAGFWNRLARQAGVPATLVSTGFVEGYFLDELAYSVALAHLPAYRKLRLLGLRRLFSAILPDPNAPGDEALATVLYEALDYPNHGVEVIHGADIPMDWRFAAARACAILITTRGAGAVTHRAVAALAEVAPTTLAYRFASHEDLVVAGLEYIISHLLRSVAEMEQDAARTLIEARSEEGLDVGRATFAVAIAAIRSASLAPCAADMRRRRGINLIRILRRRSAEYERLDLLSAQVLAVGCIGLANLQPVAEPSQPVVDQALSAASAWMFGHAPPDEAKETEPL